LLESGTLGTKAHFQVIVPYLTQSYSSTQDTQEKAIPQCTLHHFPSNINHCCIWDHEVFFNFFEKDFQLLIRYLQNPDFLNDVKQSDQGELSQNLVTLSNLINNPIINWEGVVQCVKEINLRISLI
jgi:ubiquitin-activating enzyme E1